MNHLNLIYYLRTFVIVHKQQLVHYLILFIQLSIEHLNILVYMPIVMLFYVNNIHEKQLH